MKFLLPLITKDSKTGSSLFSRSNTSLSPSQPASFGERRAQEMNSRLQKAQAERQKLIRAEFASDGHTQEIIQQKREMTDRTISRLSVANKNTEKK